jgi:hypothetical protein
LCFIFVVNLNKSLDWIGDITFVLITTEIDGMFVLMNDPNDFKIYCNAVCFVSICVVDLNIASNKKSTIVTLIEELAHT